MSDKENKPAEQNPWYVLATIYGEQSEHFDKELHAKNRRIWNGWACEHLPEEERKTLAEQAKINLEETNPWTEKERTEVTCLFKKRLGESSEVPNSYEHVDFREIYFAVPLCLDKFIFSEEA